MGSWDLNLRHPEHAESASVSLTAVQLLVLFEVLLKVEGFSTRGIGAREGLPLEVLVLHVVLNGVTETCNEDYVLRKMFCDALRSTPNL